MADHSAGSALCAIDAADRVVIFINKISLKPCKHNCLVQHITSDMTSCLARSDEDSPTGRTSAMGEGSTRGMWPKIAAHQWATISVNRLQVKGPILASSRACSWSNRRSVGFGDDVRVQAMLGLKSAERGRL